MRRWALPLATVAFFAVTAGGYGVFRDELYYLACARHLAWGYVDHPPMVALVAALTRAIAGESWIVLRLVSALAFGATVLLVGDTARRLGAGTWGTVIAQLLTATAPIYLSLFSIYSMNGLDVLIWAGLARLAAGLLAAGDDSREDPRRWLAFGALAGLGLETKLDVGLLGAGLAVGLLLARRWEILRSRWLWLGGALAAALFLPHLLWQLVNDWPTREFVANAQSGKITVLGPLAFVGSQLDLVGPVAALLAAAGFVWLLAAKAARPFRPLGWAVLTVLVVFAASVSKPYYFSPAFTILFAAAGIAVEQWTAGRRALPLRIATVVAIAAVLAFAPLAKPLLDEDAYVRYATALGRRPGTDENHRLGRLPQFFADMHGWREMAEAVARVHNTLPADDKAKACIFGQNYGEAGAIDYFGPSLGLPPAVSGHNSYWLWGPGSCTGEVLLIIGGDREDHAEHFASVEPAAVFDCVDCMPYEDDLTLWVGRGLHTPLAEAWAGVKHYD